MSLVRRRLSTSTSSLNRVNNHSAQNKNSSIASTTQTTTNKRKVLTKPAWDPTNSDLNQLKLTNEELERRRLAHQSKNVDLVKFDAIMKAKKTQPKQAPPKGQLALLQEILYDDEQLKNLILKSDSTLKKVTEFFQNEDQNANLNNNNNNKKQAKINMTLAPNVTDLNESNLPFNTNTKQKTKSMRRGDENNEMFTTNTNSDDESEIINLKIKEAKLNDELDKYRDLLELKQKLIEKKLNSSMLKNNKSSSVSHSNNNNKPTKSNEFITNELDECLQLLNVKDVNSKSKTNSNTNSLVNDSEKLNRLKSILANYVDSLSRAENIEQEEQEAVVENDADENENCSSSHHHQTNKSIKQQLLLTLNDEFQKALNDLENKLAEFEKELGRKTERQNVLTNNRSQTNKTNSSSYTLSLIKIVSTLFDYLKETTNELNYEKIRQSESNKQLDIHRKLIDGLTTEILCVKEQNDKILNEYIQNQAKTEAEIEQIKIFLKTSQQYYNQSNIQSMPPIIDPKPKMPSAFISQQQQQQQQQQQHHLSNDMTSLLRPSIQQAQQHSLPQRPMSCISSINLNDLNNYEATKGYLDEVLNAKGDKFIERINMMLQSDTKFSNNNNNMMMKPSTQLNLQNLAQTYSNKTSQLNSNNSTTTSRQFNEMAFDMDNLKSFTSNGGRSNNNHNNNNSNLSFNNFDNQNSSSSHELDAILNTNKQAMSDFNAQIQELNMKNIQAQRKLKQLQMEQQQNQSQQLKVNAQFGKMEQQEDMQKRQQHHQHRDALDKLKQEQQLLKEQINLLNKQRESAQIELEVLALTSNNAPSAKVNDTNLKKTHVQHYQNNNGGGSGVGGGGGGSRLNGSNTPSLSPIAPENIFRENGDVKNHSYERFDRPPSKTNSLELTPPNSGRNSIQNR